MRIPITIYPPHICIPESSCKQHYQSIKDFPQSSMQLTNIQQNWLPVFISKYKRKEIHIHTPTHITMTQADAENLGYKQWQKVNLLIPYKSITIPQIKIKIKDYFLLDIFMMQEEANTHGITHGDRAVILPSE